MLCQCKRVSVFSAPPACQCNGHSMCVNGSICEECQNNTVGEYCGACEPSYFGDARNGGNCSGECEKQVT